MKKNPSLIFNVLVALCLLLAAGVLVMKGVDAYRMRDPDYARMLADREHYEKVIKKSGLPMHPASYWSVVSGDRSSAALKGEADGKAKD
jgi:hypothetical protein